MMKRNYTALHDFQVLDRLEIGPVRLEEKRIRADYTVTAGARRETFEVQFCYEESVFSDSLPSVRSLADMIAAQAAVNYGLFCREIVFCGSYDRYDRRFLMNMLENTAREIYVSKLLKENRFIVDGAAAMLPQVKDSYLQAEIVFDGAAAQPERSSTSLSLPPETYAVLSSGGKESLLSFGLLDELGADVHPVFTNESGRHWFTALNAYRFFAEHYPATARVWTNVDRLFSWMLRRLPFIRTDFARLRTDYYPLRLWTVAVFVFGSLPVLLKRGIGRIVIGDEYDTTRRRMHAGIAHYDGLYDQSIYFDNALSRYYADKGWSICQFSLLRPLSEMAIEKILAERYPHLQALQTSCHAAHIDNGRALPCGRCEKCFRIIGMLTALGRDPANCGFTPEQVDSFTAAAGSRHFRQDRSDVEHMLYLLQQRGILHEEPSEYKAVPHQEIMKLRFDGERSPMNAVPSDIRQKLLSLILEHTDGAVVKVGRRWVDADLRSDPGFLRPYRFAHTGTPRPCGGDREPKRTFLLGEMRWPEVADYMKRVDIALLPVGSIEQHGPHLPLDTDAHDADYLARSVAQQCRDPKPLVLPLVAYGVSYHHEDFAGTIGISNETLSRIVYEIGMSVARIGITKLLIINGHGGNAPSLELAAQMINRDAHIFTCVDSGETSDADIALLCETANDVHAGEIETSTALAVRPEGVHIEEAEKFIPEFSSRYLNFSSKRSVQWFARTSRISRNGVLGDPTKASAEKGRRMWDIMIANLVELVEDLQGLSLDEIYERRY